MSKISNPEFISTLDAFDSMRRFLEDYWERGGKESDDIAVLLGSLNRDESSDSAPLDQALWYDWLGAVSATIASKEIKHN